MKWTITCLILIQLLMKHQRRIIKGILMTFGLYINQFHFHKQETIMVSLRTKLFFKAKIWKSINYTNVTYINHLATFTFIGYLFYKIYKQFLKRKKALYFYSEFFLDDRKKPVLLNGKWIPIFFFLASSP